jgi:hypothetical protein
MLQMIGLDFRGWLMCTTIYQRPQFLALFAVPRAALQAIKDGTFDDSVPFQEQTKIAANNLATKHFDDVVTRG